MIETTPALTLNPDTAFSILMKAREFDEKVEETDPGFKGDTANAGTKPATLETGATVDVPLFVNPGNRVRVDTRTGRYLERA